MRLTEKDLTKLVRRIISETNDIHPIDTKLWKNMLSEVEGVNVETISVTENKLVIDGIENIYTIIKTPRKK